MRKTFLEKIEEANRRPVPYEGLKVFGDAVSSKSLPESSDPVTAIDNPLHEGGFNSLLDKAADRLKQIV